MDDSTLNQRLKELWEKNTTQQNMVAILRGEGYDVTARQIARIRQKEGLMMRGPNLSDVINEENGEQTQPNEGVAAQQPERPVATAPTAVPLEIQIARQAKQAKLWAESAERMKNRSRRRRTKGYYGLPADPGLPPRFPSELTLEESRNLLYLDKALYRELRTNFEEICRAHGVERKVACAPGVWQFVKEELINRLGNLQAIFRTPAAAQLDPTKEPMALDLICMDVTKAMRVATKNITLTDAKNILSLTPDAAREVRSIFENILKENYYLNRRDVSNEEWQAYKDQWISQSPVLQREFQAVQDSEVWQRKNRALEIIARDSQKRKRDLDLKRDSNASNKRKADKAGKTSTPKKQKTAAKEKLPKTPKEKAPPTRDPKWRSASGRPPWMPTTPPPPDSSNPFAAAIAATTTQSSHPFEQAHNLAQLAAAAQIDPDLLSAAAEPDQPQPSSSTTTIPDSFNYATSLPTQPFQGVVPSPQQLQPFNAAAPPPPPQPSRASPVAATPIYIRLAPATSARDPSLPKVWLDHLYPPYTLQGLRAIVERKFAPGLGARPPTQVRKIEGLADGATLDNELGSRWDIDMDDEVEAYIGYVKESGGKVVFVVDLAWFDTLL